MTIAVCVKNIDFAFMIKQHILFYSEKSSINADVTVFTSGKELLIDRNKFEIVFIDTDIDDINSMQIANCIKLSAKNTKLIFLSDSDELVFQTLKYQPYRFIRKRYFKYELKEALLSLFYDYKINYSSFTVNSSEGIRSVSLNEIFFCEIFGHSIEIHTCNENIKTTGTLNVLQDKLEPSGFVRIHKSYLVNLRHILKFSSKEVTMSDFTVLPVSKYRSSELKNKIMHFNMVR
ncbi:LytR/AlgR family response regulator transcription factor [Porcipelethomonas sp.]|uniref:LytR/AlgR family response regulator transcription factor n=1 Tax=Porcipelethomonas sp. TaxID=2981675 RepID=UPI003EF7BAC6